MQSFLFGIFTTCCAYGLFQDWMGLEGYIQYLRNHWWNTPWWIWPPLWVIGLIGFIKKSN